MKTPIDIDFLSDNGYLILDMPKLDDTTLAEVFRKFIYREFDYKKKYLQKVYQNQLDGYSYMGQEDSLNQSKEDLVETFVLSDFTNAENYPSEFAMFFQQKWQQTIQYINDISKEICLAIDLNLKTIFQEEFSQRISCNYYPKVQNEIPQDKERLTEHNDMSLFTIFPYGVSSGLQILKNNQWKDLQENSKILVFSGFFLERLTQGKFKSLIHCVRLPKNRNQERLSFAFFSNPKPMSEFIYKNIPYTTQSLTQGYLSQFD